MADNEQGVIELSDDDEQNESDEEQELSREHGSKKNLQPLENATSVVWKFFGFLAGQDGRILEPDKRKRTEVYCNKCYARVKYTGGTSNLRYHLERHHLTEYTQALSEQASETSSSGHSSAPLDKCSKTSELNTEQTITSSFRKMTPLP